jgi:TRAP-type C4-dicarboxylate transport system substrate-binding protein
MNCILIKRWYVLMAMLVLTIFCVTVSAQAAEEKIHIRATCNVPPGDLMGDTMGQFLKILKEKSGGKVTYEMHAGGVLGSIREVHESMKGKAIQMFAGTVGDLATYDKMCDISNFPYLYTSTEQGNKIWEKIGPEFYDGVAKRSGWRILYTWVGAPRDLCTKKAVTSPDQLAGLKIRVPNWPIFIAYFKNALKASPTVVSFGELYTALKTGVVDAQENPIYRSLASGLFEVTPFVIRTQHSFDLNDVHVTEEYWQGLSPELKKLFMESAAETRAWTLNESSRIINASIGEAVNKAKINIIQPDIEAFQKAAVGIENDFPHLKELVLQIRATK